MRGTHLPSSPKHALSAGSLARFGSSATKNRSAKLWASAACYSKLCGRTCDWGGSETSTKLRDVGSLAVSAASGHKSQVLSILVCAEGRYKSDPKTGVFRVIAVSDMAPPDSRRWKGVGLRAPASAYDKAHHEPGRTRPSRLVSKLP